MGLPTIEVTFQALAASASARASRGRLVIVIRDTTSGVTWTSKTYTRLSEVDAAEFTSGNYKAIARAFLAAPYQVIVVRIGTNDDMDDAAPILADLAYHWICTPVSALQSGLAAYVKAQNTATTARWIKGIVYNVSSVDDMHVVNVANATVTEKGQTSTTAMNDYLPRLGGLLAACPLTGSVTYAALDDLEACAAVSNPGTSVDAGNLVLIKDDDTIRVARGVNTMQTVGTGQVAAMKKIAVVEALDLIREDIILTFNQGYMGKKRNSPDNQALFVSDVLEYFKGLEAEQILNPEEKNDAWIDTAALRAAWMGAGTDVSGLTDEELRKKPFGSYLYVAAQIRVLDAMEDLIMHIALA